MEAIGISILLQFALCAASLTVSMVVRQSAPTARVRLHIMFAATMLLGGMAAVGTLFAVTLFGRSSLSFLTLVPPLITLLLCSYTVTQYLRKTRICASKA